MSECLNVSKVLVPTESGAGSALKGEERVVDHVTHHDCQHVPCCLPGGVAAVGVATLVPHSAAVEARLVNPRAVHHHHDPTDLVSLAAQACGVLHVAGQCST